MAKFYEISEEMTKVFNEVIDKTTIPEFAGVMLLGVEGLKESYKPVKATDMVKFFTKSQKYPDGVGVLILIDETIVSELDIEDQKMFFEQCLAHVYYNPENDRIKLDKTDLNLFLTMYDKYDTKIIEVNKKINLIKKQKEDRENEMKQK